MEISMLDRDRTRLFGSILLLAGSCVGVGMLALPVVTGVAGFVPSLVVFVAGWVYMTITALLLLEINVWLGTEISIISMAGRTLGRIGQTLSWILFCYLFYLLLVAYSAGSGELVADFVEDFGGARPPGWVGSVICTALFGILVYFGTVVVDYVNRLFMLGLIVSYLMLIGFGIPQIRSELLTYMSWTGGWIGAPVVVISFGLHNMIPTVTRYLKGNMRQLRIAIICGTTLPLIIYLLWEWVILGIVPAQNFAQSVSEGNLVTRALPKSDWVRYAAEGFSFFAIVTSFIAQALALRHFLADGLRAPNSKPIRVLLTLVAVVPPLLAALYNPRLFIQALELAGAFGAVVLFGIMPALMVWVARYRERGIQQRAIVGGRPLLVLILLVSVAVIVAQIFHQLGVF